MTEGSVMNSTVFAPLLSALLPGAGLWYLGEIKLALMNFLLALVVTACAAISGSEHIHYVFLAVATGSAGYAHAVARSMQRT
jgi:hypothetical protein